VLVGVEEKRKTIDKKNIRSETRQQQSVLPSSLLEMSDFSGSFRFNPTYLEKYPQRIRNCVKK
jgi:hypothetical protein